MKGVYFRKSAYRYYNFQLRRLTSDEGGTRYNQGLINSYRVLLSTQFIIIPMIIILIDDVTIMIAILIVLALL